MYGHTHKPDIKSKNNVIIFNPGHLKEGDTRGFPHTYAYLTVSEDSLKIEILKLSNHSIYKEETFHKQTVL